MISSGDSSPTAAMMRNLAVFGMLDDKELGSLATVFRSVHFIKGAVLFQEGRAARCFFVIVEGRVALSKRLGRIKRSLTTLDKDSIVGHAALIDQGLNEATAVASSDVLALTCDRDMFHRLAASASPLALKLMVPLVTACCRSARASDALVHGLYAEPQATLLTLHTA